MLVNCYDYTEMHGQQNVKINVASSVMDITSILEEEEEGLSPQEELCFMELVSVITCLSKVVFRRWIQITFCFYDNSCSSYTVLAKK